MKKFFFSSSIIIMICFTWMLSCNKVDTGTAMISVRLHDDPQNYDSVLIEILEVRIHTSDSGWFSLNTQAGVYDLLQLQNGVDTLLVPPQQIGAGKISQIRFILGDDNKVVEDGVDHDLLLSSQDESGLKLNLHEDIIAGQEYVITIDFDAAQSIIEEGNGEYRLKPVLTADLQ